MLIHAMALAFQGIKRPIFCTSCKMGRGGVCGLSVLSTQRFGRRSGNGFLPIAATVCLILLALLAVAQVTHQHINQTDSDHCQLCIAMHTVAPAAIAALAITMVRLGTTAAAAEPIVEARQPQFRLFIRPPPVSL
jgi:hypothetical protein